MLKGKTPLIVALVLGMLAGVMAYNGLKKKEHDVKKGWNLIGVVVANEDIPEGTVVTFEMISQRSIPEQFVTSSLVKPDSASYIANQKILVPVQKGDPLLWSQFEQTKTAERLSAKVQKRTRAVTIIADGVASVGGWVRPNDHIDVIGTFRDPQINDMVAVTLLQNVTVLATGKITGTTNINLIPENERRYNDVSLLVIPEEAEVLALAAALGDLKLSLRHEDDLDMIEDRGRTNLQTLLSGERMRILGNRRSELIQIIRGASSDKSAIGASGPQ
jgi:pilus assembly protein CpaB